MSRGPACLALYGMRRSLSSRPKSRDPYAAAARLVTAYGSLLSQGRLGEGPSRKKPVNICVAQPRSRGRAEQLAADQHAADLGGSGADLVELGIPQQAGDRIVVGVAVAAQGLDGLQRHLGGMLGRIEEGAGRIHAIDAALVAGARHRLHVGPAG